MIMMNQPRFASGWSVGPATLLALALACQPQPDPGPAPGETSVIPRAIDTATGSYMESMNYTGRDPYYDAIGALTVNGGGYCSCVKIDDVNCLSAAHCFLSCDQAKPKVALRDITFAAGSSNPFPPIPGNTYGVAIPWAYWVGCNIRGTINKTTDPKIWEAGIELMRQNDLAVIRFRGAFNVAANQGVAMHLGNVNPSPPFVVHHISSIPMGLVADNVTNVPIRVLGYPAVPLRYQGHGGTCNLPVGTWLPIATQWTFPTLSRSYGNARQTTLHLNPHGSENQNIYYDANTAGGESGAAVVGDDDRVIAIHNGGEWSGSSTCAVNAKENRGLRLTVGVQHWINQVKGR
jgi:hypothetical protein